MEDNPCPWPDFAYASGRCAVMNACQIGRCIPRNTEGTNLILVWHSGFGYRQGKLNGRSANVVGVNR